MINKEGKLVSSYSQINLYQQCPYRWYLNYKKQIKSKEKSKHLEYGSMVHETLEDYFKSIMFEEKFDLDYLLCLYDINFGLYEIPFENDEESEEYYKLGIDAINKLFNPQDEFTSLINKSTVIGVEEEFSIKIKGVEIRGFIDLIIKTKEGIIPIDHKTSSKIFTKSKLNKDLQFPIYNMAILDKYRELPIISYYNFTKLGKLQGVAHTKDTLKKSEEEIIKVFDSMCKSTHRAKPTPLCYWCDYSKHSMNICQYSSDWKPKK